MRISNYQLVDHGIDHSQYFQGCGVSFTDYDHVVTGIGDDFMEALDDALEMMTQSDETDGVDFEALQREIIGEYGVSEGRVTDDSEEMYYYLSIRYNVEES